MRRPRWHDVLIALAIVGVGLAGAWAFWGDRFFGAPVAPPPAAPTSGAS